MLIDKKILIFQNLGLGDLLITVPVLKFLRTSYPDYHIEVWSKLRYSNFLSDLKVSISGKSYSLINNVREYNKSWISPLVSDKYLTATFREYLAEIFDNVELVICYLIKDSSIFINNLKTLGVKQVVSLSVSDTNNGYSKEVHRIDQQYIALKKYFPLNIGVNDFIVNLCDFEIVTNKFVSDNINRFMSSNKLQNEKIVAIHPGSSDPKKCWHQIRYSQICNRLHNELPNHKILIINGPCDSNVSTTLKNYCKFPIYLTYPYFTITELAFILKQCCVYLGNDDGVSHLAASLGVPTIAIFGPSNSNVWQPKGRNVRIVKTNVGCNPCACEVLSKCSQQYCLENVNVEQVYNEVKSVILKA
ncbi:MAG: glycosyltransferase family 9 protein [Elusimicrobiota bacterium]